MRMTRQAIRDGGSEMKSAIDKTIIREREVRKGMGGLLVRKGETNGSAAYPTQHRTILAFLVVLAIALTLTMSLTGMAFAQIPSGPNSPTAAANNAAVGSKVWSSPTNIFALDNAYAAAVGMVNNQASAYLVASGFGFAIPTGATITGIQVSVTRLQGSEPGTATIQDYSVKIVGGGVITGVDHAATGNNWPTTNADYTYGSSSDTWGATWTPADINASNFGVAVSAMGVASDSSYQDALIDYVSIMVYYTQ